MRLDKAAHALPYCGCHQRDKDGKITKVYTPAMRRDDAKEPETGTKKVGFGKFAIVDIERNQNQINLSCRTYNATDADEGEICPAIQEGYVCYHCLAALMLVGLDNGNKVSFFKTSKEAKGDGRLIEVWAGGLSFFIMVTPKNPKKPEQTQRTWAQPQKPEHKQEPPKKTRKKKLPKDGICGKCGNVMPGDPINPLCEKCDEEKRTS